MLLRIKPIRIRNQEVQQEEPRLPSLNADQVNLTRPLLVIKRDQQNASSLPVPVDGDDKVRGVVDTLGRRAALARQIGTMALLPGSLVL